MLLTIPAGADAGVHVDCDEGDIASGGGYSTRGEAGALHVYEARPQAPEEAVMEDGSDTPTFAPRYLVRAVNDAATDADIQAWVICLDLAD